MLYEVITGYYVITPLVADEDEPVLLVNRGWIEKADFYRPEREAQVLRAVAARNKGPLSNEQLLRLFP